MKRNGKIQMQFKPTVLFKERNEVVRFSGLWQLIKLCIKAYKKNPNKVYIFFDEAPNKTD